MERKKGYTLVELLTIIVILGILVGLATPVISKIIEYTKQKKVNTFIDTAKRAAYLNYAEEQKNKCYSLDQLLDSNSMKSPYGNDFKGDICIVCTNKCELFDIVYVELNGEKIRYSNTNDTYLNDTPYLDLINLDNNSFFKKYGYIIIPKSNTDRDIYDNYIIKKDKEVSILKNNIIINSDYNYVVGDKKIKVLVLANNGEKVTLFVYDENFYKLDELEKLLSIEVNDGDEVRFFDTEDMEVRIKEDSNSGLKPIITYSNDNENTNFWVKNNNENNNENNFIVIHKENDEYKILNNVNSVTTARIGIVIETKNFDKIVSINND